MPASKILLSFGFRPVSRMRAWKSRGRAVEHGGLPAASGDGASGQIPAARLLAVVELRELNRIRVNLNQMARVLNPGAATAPAETREAEVV